jgi:hypothetical protein
MSNFQYQKTFDSLMKVIKPRVGGVGVHWRVVCLILEKDTGIKYKDCSWMTDYRYELFDSVKMKAKEKVLAHPFLYMRDKERYGPMLVTSENDNTRVSNALPETRKAGFGILNKWTTAYEKKFYNGGAGYSNSNGSSFSQAIKKEGIYCWGVGKKVWSC